jgi:hypothetical protein
VRHGCTKQRLAAAAVVDAAAAAADLVLPLLQQEALHRCVAGGCAAARWEAGVAGGVLAGVDAVLVLLLVSLLPLLLQRLLRVGASAAVPAAKAASCAVAGRCRQPTAPRDRGLQDSLQRADLLMLQGACMDACMADA